MFLFDCSKLFFSKFSEKFSGFVYIQILSQRTTDHDRNLRQLVDENYFLAFQTQNRPLVEFDRNRKPGFQIPPTEIQINASLF